MAVLNSHLHKRDGVTIITATLIWAYVTDSSFIIKYLQGQIFICVSSRIITIRAKPSDFIDTEEQEEEEKENKTI